LAIADIVAEAVILEYPLVYIVMVIGSVVLVDGEALYLIKVIVLDVPAGYSGFVLLCIMTRVVLLGW